MRKNLITLLLVFMIGITFITAGLAVVPDTTYNNTYTGNGSSTAYAFTWRVTDPTQMIVQVNGVTQSSSLYTVYQNTNGIGGTVTFNSAPANLAAILIQRNSDFLQPNSFQNNGAIPLKTLEGMMDKLTILCQQLETQLTNSGTLPINPLKGTLLVGNGTGWTSLTPPVSDGLSLVSRASTALGLNYELISGGGGGSGTVGSGNAGDIAYYPGTGTGVSGEPRITAAQMLALTSGQIYQGNGSNVVTPTTVTGDFTLSSSGVASLPVSGVTAASYLGGNGSSFTFDSKGRCTTAVGQKRFTSADQTISNAGSLTLAHGLGVTPAHVWYALVNTITEGGYAVNDVVTNPSNNTGGSPAVSIWADGTNINARFINASGTFSVNNKTTGASVNITAADWKLRVYAEP